MSRDKKVNIVIGEFEGNDFITYYVLNDFWVVPDVKILQNPITKAYYVVKAFQYLQDGDFKLSCVALDEPIRTGDKLIVIK